MDKETLSHYGWIVILVLILAVLLALASPFGSFIAGAIKSTTAGLFDVNQAALGSAGINVDDLVFENCDHLETEVRNMSDTYTGDTCCKACGAVLQAGQTVRPKVPEGGTYYVGVTNVKAGNTGGYTAKYGPGEEMPETVTVGDVYIYGDYEYRYGWKFNSGYGTNGEWRQGETQNGWGVRVRSTEKTAYENFLTSINGAPITHLKDTYWKCTALVDASNIKIPSTVVDMSQTFKYCSSLKIAPDMTNANNVSDMNNAFNYCTSLILAPDMSNASSVTNMNSIFFGCTALSNTPIIPNSVTDLSSAFYNCISLTNEDLPNIPNGVKTLNKAFDGCTGLTDASNFVIPSSVTDISYLFEKCTSLVKAPNFESATGVTNAIYLFHNCSSLTTVPNLPSNLTSLYWTFKGCTSLVDLSDTVMPNYIGRMNSTYYGCSSLQSVPIIPSSVYDLDKVFYECTSLTGTITINSSSFPTSNYINNCFYGVDFDAQNLSLAGTTPSFWLDSIGATGTNYCSECNGKCNGGH